MITAVDTNILVDILEPDPVHGPAYREALRRCLREGSVVACEVVWAEVVTAYGHSQDAAVDALTSMGIAYSEIGMEAALQAAKCWYTTAGEADVDRGLQRISSSGATP